MTYLDRQKFEEIDSEDSVSLSESSGDINIVNVYRKSDRALMMKLGSTRKLKKVLDDKSSREENKQASRQLSRRESRNTNISN